MPAVVFYFQVHQPQRVRKYRIFDVGQRSNYFSEDGQSRLNNKKILQKVANKCYLPTNALLLKLLQNNPRFKISFSFSGVFLDQLEGGFDDVLESFRKLVETQRVEILSETYFHSLSYLFSKKEFEAQVKLHKRKIKDLFGITPRVFRNTELIYNNELAGFIKQLGYKGIISEGADHLLGWRSPNFVYKPPNTDIKILLKNYKLSDDIAFRFSSKQWSEYPLTAEKFANWVSAINGNGELINLFMDYETFGEHQWEDSGIFRFLEYLPEEILKNPDNSFLTPSEALEKFPIRGVYDCHSFISWADVERDLSAWLSNSMQQTAINALYNLERQILSSKDKNLINDWRRLQTSDHFYYMCTKWFNDGDVHKYFNPYDSPYEAFIAYMNVLRDLKLRLESRNTISASVFLN